MHPVRIRPLSSKSEEARKRVRGSIKDIIGEEGDKDRVCTMGFAKSISKCDLARIQPNGQHRAHLPLGQSIYCKVKEMGLSSKYQEEEGLRAKTRSAIGPPPH